MIADRLEANRARSRREVARKGDRFAASRRVDRRAAPANRAVRGMTSGLAADRLDSVPAAREVQEALVLAALVPAGLVEGDEARGARERPGLAVDRSADKDNRGREVQGGPTADRAVAGSSRLPEVTVDRAALAP